MITWYPDFCPTGQCVIELEKADGSVNWTTPRAFHSVCPHHQGLGLSDQQRFDAILQSSRRKEAARRAVKQSLGLNKEHPGVPYTVNPDGSFLVTTNPALLGWKLPDGSPGPLPDIRNIDRNRARGDALLAIGLVRAAIGASVVEVD